jgi:hypothetical protein
MVGTPMPLIRRAEPFDSPDWVFEVKWDGFRAVAIIDGDRLRAGVAQRVSVRAVGWTHTRHRENGLVHDGEIVCLDDTNRADFYGAFTLNARSATGGACTGTSSFSGPASSSNTMTWTSGGFTGNCTGMPLNVRLVLQRR